VALQAGRTSAISSSEAAPTSLRASAGEWPRNRPREWPSRAGHPVRTVARVTALDTRPQVPVRLDVDGHAPHFMRALSHLDNATVKEVERTGLPPLLAHLVRLRASQLNGCAYCVDMHTKDLRTGGEAEQRIAALPVWRETAFFDETERAALAFAESVTLCARTHVPAPDFDAIAARLSQDQLGALLAVVVTVNAWNAIGVAARPWQPGSYRT
jgi:AhpD family alkylhydroperoxidase